MMKTGLILCALCTLCTGMIVTPKHVSELQHDSKAVASSSSWTMRPGQCGMKSDLRISHKFLALFQKARPVALKVHKKKAALKVHKKKQGQEPEFEPELGADGDGEDDYGYGDGDGDGEDYGDGAEMDGMPPRKKGELMEEMEAPPKEIEKDDEAEAPAEPEPPSKPVAGDVVLKDGFMRIACVKDYMYNHGDKHGKNKHSYELGKNNPTSIVHYDDAVAREDQKDMTPEVCFDFCRSVPEMGFFGILNGRNCYCAPYFKQMAGDSSMCDASCPGDPTNMCGGKAKSGIYSMHMCDSSKQELSAAHDKAGIAVDKMDEKAKAAKDLSTDMQAGADSLQKSLGAAGDSAATDLMQKAKVFAGELEHQGEDVAAVSASLVTLRAGSETPPESVRKAESMKEKYDEVLAQGRAVTEKLDGLIDLATTSDAEQDQETGAAKQYYPLMYFIDKDFDKKPSTCGGDSIGKPLVDVSLDGCAWKCDEHVDSCVGFSYYGEQQLCFLMTKFTSAFYYTGCKDAEKAPPGALEFLQQRTAVEVDAADVTCMAKFSEFSGTTLKPDPSGKCKQCLKTLTKADRCYK